MDRIPRGRFHTTILGGLFQVAKKPLLRKVVQLHSKQVYSTFPIGATRKKTLGIEFHDVGFIPPFWVGFSKQRKNTCWRRSSKCVFSTFPIGAKRKNTLGIEFDGVGFIPPFWVGVWRQRKNPCWRRSQIAFKTRFFDFPHQGETKKHPWDRIPRGRFHTTILGGLFQAAQKPLLTNILQLRSKRVFWTFPIRAKRKNTLGIEFHEVGFIPPFWVGFSKQRKNTCWRRASNCVANAFFGLSQSGRNENTPLESNSTWSVLYHHFGWAFPSSVKTLVDEGHPIVFKTRSFNFPNRGQTKRHPWDRIPRGRFHTTILAGLFQAAQKPLLTKVLQLRSKRVFSTFPIGAKRKDTLGIEFHDVGFIPPFWVGFSKQRKNTCWRRSSNCVQIAFFRLSPLVQNEKTPLGSNSTRSVSYHHFGWAFEAAQKPLFTKVSNCVQNAFFRLSPTGRNEKKPLGSNSTRSVSYHHFGWAFEGSAKTLVDEGLKFRSKRVFSTFPIRAKRKNTLGIEFHDVGFIPPFWVGFYKQRKNRCWWRSSNCVQNVFFRLSPFGRKEKTPLGSNSMRSVSYHHFGWAFPSSAKSRFDESRPITFKTRFFDSPNRGETKKHPWNRIGRGRFHTTILGGLFQAAQKAGLTKVVQ